VKNEFKHLREARSWGHIGERQGS